MDSHWLRIYQYERSMGGYESDVKNLSFYFSENGRRDPRAEMEAAIEAFESAHKRYGSLNLPAACAFPARKRVLELILNRNFPDFECPELKTWQERLNVNSAHLVYVGSYTGNPASILGHTFLRLSNSDRENSGRSGLDLLSYSVGYSAHTDPRDSQAIFMLKGLTGGYPGFYDIEPHYMKVGLYNNSESRDVWEVQLSLSSSEIDLLSKLIWEYTFNAEIDYYFIGKNCSYRILKLIEAVKPEIRASERFGGAVLPAETVRALTDQKVINPGLRFRSSIKRRMELKLALLSSDDQGLFEGAKRDLFQLRKIQNPTVLDALIDYWIYENYQSKTELPSLQREIMEVTFQRAAEVKGQSSFQITNEEIRSEHRLSPPFLGHKSSWVEAEGGMAHQEGVGGLSFRSGVHPAWSNDPSYQDISPIEYLGGEIRWFERRPSQWSLLVAKIQNLENYFNSERPGSWGFEAKLTNTCELCLSSSAAATVSGSYGLSFEVNDVQISFLPEVQLDVWTERRQLSGLFASGLRSVLRTESGPYVFRLEAAVHWFQSLRDENLDGRIGYLINKNRQVFLKFSDRTLGVSWVEFI
ncbi:MAG: DUF4105 domain-containing protein [Bdellovibrionales bacterium]|nr:DUF4105 domain-containing protein [Bdellovibrionales bacterium]